LGGVNWIPTSDEHIRSRGQKQQKSGQPNAFFSWWFVL